MTIIDATTSKLELLFEQRPLSAFCILIGEQTYVLFLRTTKVRKHRFLAGLRLTKLQLNYHEGYCIRKLFLHHRYASAVIPSAKSQMPVKWVNLTLGNFARIRKVELTVLAFI